MKQSTDIQLVAAVCVGGCVCATFTRSDPQRNRSSMIQQHSCHLLAAGMSLHERPGGVAPGTAVVPGTYQAAIRYSNSFTHKVSLRAPTSVLYCHRCYDFTPESLLSLCSQTLGPGVRDTKEKSMMMRRTAVRARLKPVSTQARRSGCRLQSRR